MVEFDDAHDYLAEVIPQRTTILMEMEKYAKENDFPIIGPLVGRLMHQLATITKAKKILELGSGYGYSAYWFSLAVGSKGHLTLTDNNKSYKKIAMDYFQRGGIRSQIEFKIGDAISIAKKLSGPFDIIFNDIDKVDYPKTVDLAAGLLKKGGLFITDNLLADGLVYAKNPEQKGKAVREFTDKLYKDNRFFTTIVPLRDGVSIAIRQ